MVQMVILGSYDRKFARENQDFYEILAEIISSKRTVRSLINADNYDEWLTIVNNFEKERQ